MFGSYVSEKELEADVLAYCELALRREGVAGLAITGFGLDIAVIQPKAIKLLELKAFSSGHGRCGIGNPESGNQIRLLYDLLSGAPRSPSELAILDRHIRWILCNRDLEPGARRFALFDCSTAARSVYGTLAPGKQNNFNLGKLDWLDDMTAKDALEKFLFEDS